jgi:hypothetical protein
MKFMERSLLWLKPYNPTELLLRKSFCYMKSTIERMRAK